MKNLILTSRKFRLPSLAYVLVSVMILCQVAGVDNSFAQEKKAAEVTSGEAQKPAVVTTGEAKKATEVTSGKAEKPAATSISKAKKSNGVTFNFVDVDLPVVTKFISDITGKNFIFDDKVKGKITIIAPTKLSIEQAYNLFTAVLDIKGFTVVPSGVDAYKIVPSIEAKQMGMQISTTGTPPNASYIARVITFKHIPADDAMKFLQPLVSRDGLISTFGPGNLLLVVDSGLNIEKILSLAELIDKAKKQER